jgi:hypothetical protein
VIAKYLNPKQILTNEVLFFLLIDCWSLPSLRVGVMCGGVILYKVVVNKTIVSIVSCDRGSSGLMDGWILGGGDRAPARGPRFGLIVLLVVA